MYVILYNTGTEQAYTYVDVHLPHPMQSTSNLMYDYKILSKLTEHNSHRAHTHTSMVIRVMLTSSASSTIIFSSDNKYNLSEFGLDAIVLNLSGHKSLNSYVTCALCICPYCIIPNTHLKFLSQIHAE